MSADQSRSLHVLPVHTLANGHQLGLHVHEIRGARPGPTLGIIGTIHGDEPLSIEIIRRIVQATDPATLGGTIRALPVANPYALMSLTRNTPIDMNNLNRIFPGDQNGFQTEQLASVIAEKFIPGIEYLIDLHSGGNLATVDYAYIHDEGSELSRVFGLDLLYRGKSYPGSLGDVARKQGIPTVVSELGGGMQKSEYFVERGVRSIRNVMIHLGMIEGTAVRPAKQTIINDMSILRPHHGGLMYSEVTVDQLGSSVPKGTVLGRIVSPFTFEELEVVEAPFEPSILVLVREPVTKVDPGDYGFMVADGSTAEPA
jgi:predicted deacylase